jgi:hypothetical protein
MNGQNTTSEASTAHISVQRAKVIAFMRCMQPVVCQIAEYPRRPPFIFKA